MHPPRILQCLFLASACSALASPPDRLDGYIYYEAGKTIARSSYETVQTFTAEGTYAQLSARVTGLFPSESRPSPPESGTFAYRKLDEATAELTFTRAGDPPALASKRTLHFTSASGGDVESDASAGVSFRLAALAQRSPLVNCSNRSEVDPAAPAFTGFVLTGGNSRLVLVRAVGPGLGPFGVANFLRNPRLDLTRAGTSSPVGSNDDWSSENAEAIRRTGAAAGAFPLSPDSKDSAIVLVLPPGGYIAQTSPASDPDAGNVLIEVYVLP
mgnify:CR=1 FL=1